MIARKGLVYGSCKTAAFSEVDALYCQGISHIIYQQGIEPAQLPTTSQEGDFGRESEGNRAIFLDDHVQLLARRKALNISTTRQKESDQPRKVNVISDSSSSYPLLQAKAPKFIRSAVQ